MLIIGLTGGIGSGKSVLSELFAELGVPILDADVIAREVVAPGTPALANITAHFGANILDANGALDRAALRKIVFADQSALRWLENLTHPLIRERLQQALTDIDAPYTVLVSPLLLETDQHELVDRVLVVDAPEGAADQVKRIMAAQAGRQTRLAKADDVISNDADLGTLKSRVAALHQTYLEIARKQ